MASAPEDIIGQMIRGRRTSTEQQMEEKVDPLDNNLLHQNCVPLVVFEREVQSLKKENSELKKETEKRFSDLEATVLALQQKLSGLCGEGKLQINGNQDTQDQDGGDLDGGAVGGGGVSKKLSAAGNMDQNQHSLGVDLVLQNVFRYSSSAEEVKRNRLVCRKWLEASTRQWTTLTKTLTLYRGDRAEEQRGDGKTLEEIWTICKKAEKPLEESILYRKFRFHLWTFDQALINSIKELDGDTAENFLWSRIAPRLITDLTLDQCQFPVEFTVFTQQFVEALPNLVRMTVHNCGTSEKIINDLVNVNPRRPPPTFVHRKLKFLSVTQVAAFDIKTAHAVVMFLDLVPNVEVLRLLNFSNVGYGKFFYFLWFSNAHKQLKELDFLDFSSAAQNDPDWMDTHLAYEGENLKALHYDIGYEKVCGMWDLWARSKKVKSVTQWHLYRAPFVEPIAEVYTGSRFLKPRITELHLWGNVTGSLDFLNYFPSLKVLMWNSSCYEEEYHGQRLYGVLERSRRNTYPLMDTDLVEKTKSDIPRMEHLVKLEIDWAVKSASSWNKLGEWMPNLVSFKGMVEDSIQLSIIEKAWGNLENLELAHGSTVLGEVVINQLGNFKKLKEFAWVCCPCNEYLWYNLVADDQKHHELENKLGMLLRKKEILPWGISKEKEKVVGENLWKNCTRSGSKKICIRAEFENMLKTGDPSEYLRLVKEIKC